MPNFPVCGPLFGKEMGQLKSALAGLSADQVLALEDGGSIEVLGRNLDLSHLEVRRVATDGADIETSGGVTVFFDTVLSEELVAEGRAREFVNRVQKMRKDADFYVSDRIVVELHTDSDLLKALEKHSEYIKQETLAVQLNALDSAPSGGELVQTHAIDDFTVSVGLYRANGVD